MVHALREAHRVLQSHGRLVDLRPADRDRQVRIYARRAWQPLGRILVNDVDVRAADGALERAVDRGLYYPVASRTLRVRRHFSTLRDWREYLAGLTSSRPEPGLQERVHQAFRSSAGLRRIVVEIDLTLRVLTKD